MTCSPDWEPRRGERFSLEAAPDGSRSKVPEIVARELTVLSWKPPGEWSPGAGSLTVLLPAKATRRAVRWVDARGIRPLSVVH